MKTKMLKQKYLNPRAAVNLRDRKWPSRIITESPIWCSVDLRDGNQALPNPLNPVQKLEYFNLLCEIGFKQIEVSFPSASQDDYNFTRKLIEENIIPKDVFIMGLVQSRAHLIEKTMKAMENVKHGIVHVYCATSELHMQQVFNLNRKETMKMIVEAITLVRDIAGGMSKSDIRLEFSPEEFTDTDINFALDICEAVFDTWGKGTTEKPLIVNLPATVERRPPNQYADMVEYFCKKYTKRKRSVISVHAHNDQGMAVAATEMALLAGADRVEGTLFGHGERTGNVDIVTIANNLYTRGIKTGLDFSDLAAVARKVEKLTGMPVYYRQPYAGELVFTAFSGSHQDAIRKGMYKLKEAEKKFGMKWKVPYLHIDPTDLGRKYEQLIRINSQSGKGGAVWIMEQEFGIKIPKEMHAEFGTAVQAFSDKAGREVTKEEVFKIFKDVFINAEGPYHLIGFWPRPDTDNPTYIHGELRMFIHGEEKFIIAEGNGPISAFVHCLSKLVPVKFSIEDYDEQAIGKGADAQAVAFVPLKLENGNISYGIGMDTNIDQAAVKAIIAGLNRIRPE